MSKNKQRVKFDAKGNPIGKKQAARSDPSPVLHRPKIKRPHIAQELRDRGLTEEAENTTRHLLPHLRGRVQGLRDNHYRFPGFRSSARRDIIQKVTEE